MAVFYLYMTFFLIVFGGIGFFIEFIASHQPNP